MKKRIFVSLLATMLLVSAVLGIGVTTSAASAPAVDPNTPVVVDGDLSEWANVEKLPMNEVDADAKTMAASSTDYVQFQYEDGYLYYAVTVADSTDVVDGLNRDHIRVCLKLPDGSLGVFHDDNDGWLNIDAALAEWWGMGSASTFVNAVGALNDQTGTFGIHKYNADGTLTFEGRLKFTDATAAQVKDAAELNVAISYYGNFPINGNVYSGDKWSCWGVANVNDVPVFPDEITGTLQLTKGTSTAPEEVETVPYTGTYFNTEPALDGDLSEWKTVEKQYLSAYDATTNTWTVSETDYVQIAATEDSVYVAYTVTDSARSLDGIKRDHIRISLITPDGALGLMYTDNDTWNQTSVSDLQGWWGVPATFTTNAIIAANSTSAFVYNEDGTVTVEARACLKDVNAAKESPALEAGDEIRLAVQYLNDENCTAQAFGGTAWYALGTNVLVPDTEKEIVAAITFSEAHTHTYVYPCDATCAECGELTNEEATHSITHVDAVAGTDCQTYDGNVEYWTCSDCGAVWLDEALTQQTNRMSVAAAGEHDHVDGVCTVCGDIDGWYTRGNNTYYYVDGVAVKELQEIDGKYYYFSIGDGRMLADKSIWVSGSNSYGLKAGSYMLGADGALIVDGFVTDVNGKVYYRENGEVLKGLVQIEGEYYYFNAGDGHALANTTVWVSIDGTAGLYKTDARGKLEMTGFVTGSNGYVYYRKDGEIQMGLVQIDGKYYYFSTGDGHMLASTEETIKTIWVSSTNPYGLTAGVYTLGTDGALIIEE